MRHAIAASLLVGFSLVLSPLGGCKDEENTYGACVDFCNSLVDAMEESDWYHLSSVSETKDQCKAECSDTLREMDGDERGDAEDCLDCITGTIDADEDWTENEITAESILECDDECYDNNDDPQDDPFVMFFTDFYEDFDEHFSNSTPGSDGDADSDSDSDSDGDSDLYCDGYQGSDECCITYDACGWADDGECDCDGYCGWDYLDCGY